MRSTVAVAATGNASAVTRLRRLTTRVEVEDTLTLDPRVTRRDHGVVHVQQALVLDLELCGVDEHLGGDLLELARAAALDVQRRPREVALLCDVSKFVLDQQAGVTLNKGQILVLLLST